MTIKKVTLLCILAFGCNAMQEPKSLVGTLLIDENVCWSDLPPEISQHIAQYVIADNKLERHVLDNLSTYINYKDIKADRKYTAGAQFSNSGDLIVSFSASDSCKSPKIWDAKTLACKAELFGHTNVITDALFSNSGKLVATTSYDGTARLWNAEDGACIFTLEGHEHLIWTASFDDEDARLVTASPDGTARIWDVQTGESLFTLDAGIPVAEARFLEGGAYVYTGLNDRTSLFWDAKTGEQYVLTRKIEEINYENSIIQPKRTLWQKLMVLPKLWLILMVLGIFFPPIFY